jgi:hypothetical protein
VKGGGGGQSIRPLLNQIVTIWKHLGLIVPVSDGADRSVTVSNQGVD